MSSTAILVNLLPLLREATATGQVSDVAAEFAGSLSDELRAEDLTFRATQKFRADSQSWDSQTSLRDVVARSLATPGLESFSSPDLGIEQLCKELGSVKSGVIDDGKKIGDLLFALERIASYAFRTNETVDQFRELGPHLENGEIELAAVSTPLSLSVESREHLADCDLCRSAVREYETMRSRTPFHRYPEA